MDLLPGKCLFEIAKVMSFGAIKYGDYNWHKGINYNRIFAALNRHIWAWWDREDTDKETSLNHLAHAGCCLLFLLHYSLFNKKYRKFDDRPEKI